MTMTTTPRQATSLSKEYERLSDEITELEGRLEKGMELYHGSNDPEQRKRYYERWLPILREYERVYQERRNLGYVPQGAQ